MVGPFMQGIVLMGIIYWYTKGMMNLISDYYRTEFQRKIKLDDRQQNRTNYDTDDIGHLIETEKLLNFEASQVDVVEKNSSIEIPSDQQRKPWLMEVDGEGVEKDVCTKADDIEMFMRLINEFATINGKISPWAFAVCTKDSENIPNHQIFI